MKYFKSLAILFISATIFQACTQEDVISYAFQEISAPTKVSADFDITQDDTGVVTITPSGEGVSSFKVYFGDAQNESPEEVSPGSSVTHTYAEGEYKARVIGVGSTGLTSEFAQQIMVSFRAPENMVLTVVQSNVNPKLVTVDASADFATLFDVYFGDVVDEVPTIIMPNETLDHTYTDAGEYTIRVVARGAGAATTEASEVVVITDASDPITLPIDFESFTVNYAFESFGDAAAEVVDNPNKTGINTSDKTGQLTKPAGAQVWAGAFLQLEDPIDFTNKLFKVKVFSPKSGITVKLKVENATDGNIAHEVDVINTVANDWEELTFDFSAIDTNNEYHKVVIFFDFGADGDGSVYQFDDFNLVPASIADSVIVENFEGTAPTFTVFGNIADTQVIANPDATGLNTTANVAQLTKTGGSETWAGSFFETTPALDLTNYQYIKVRTWSPKTGIVVKLKLENLDGSVTHEVDVTNTMASTWEELVYDFSGAPAAEYVRVVIFFDFGNNGDDSIYYFDEIELTNGTTSNPPLSFQDFEATAPTFTVFGNIADTQVIDNPDASGVNTTAKVAQLTKTGGSETWAGTFFELASPLDFDNYSKISVKTWSPKNGAVVKVKIENADGSVTHEVDLNSTVANAWEELVYDFSAAPAAAYTRVVIFFDFGNNGDDSLYYFDQYTLTN